MSSASVARISRLVVVLLLTTLMSLVVVSAPAGTASARIETNKPERTSNLALSHINKLQFKRAERYASPAAVDKLRLLRLQGFLFQAVVVPCNPGPYRCSSSMRSTTTGKIVKRVVLTVTGTPKLSKVTRVSNPANL